MDQIKVIDEVKTEQRSNNSRNYPHFYELNMTRNVEYNSDLYDVKVYCNIVETLCDTKHQFAEIKINKNNNHLITVVIDIYWNDYYQSYNDHILPVVTECKEYVTYEDFEKIVGINFNKTYFDNSFDIKEEFIKDMEFNHSNNYKRRLNNY